MDWSFETFRGNEFRGSTILDGRVFNFRGLRKICEFMRLKNLALYGSSATYM